MNEPLIKEIRVECAVEHAFDVFTARVDLWWPPSHRPRGAVSLQLEPTVGGSFYAERDDGTRVEMGQVLAVDPPSLLRYSWNPGRGAGPTAVEVRFVGDDDHTVVRVVHSEADSELGPEWSRRVKVFANAWDDVLQTMAQFVASGG